MITKESPLKGMKIGTVATVEMRELPGLPTIDLRVEKGSATHTVVTEALGLDLPVKPGQALRGGMSGGNEVLTCCLAPDWWLIIGFDEAEQQLEPLRSDNHFHFSVVDVSDQRTTIELTGPNVRDLLACLWDQDLREKAFPIGSVSQGLMAKAPVIVCHVAPFLYRVMVRSSFALHLWQALADAAEEWI